MYDKASIAELKRVRVERVTATACVVAGPALIYSISIHSDGTAEADADVYDGVSAGGRPKLDLYCVDESMAQLVYPTPLYFDQGVYVVIGTKCEAVVIQYKPLLGRADDLH